MVSAATGRFAAAVASTFTPRMSLQLRPSTFGKSEALHVKERSSLNARPKLFMSLQLLEACADGTQLTDLNMFSARHDWMGYQRAQVLNPNNVDGQITRVVARAVGMLAATFIATSTMGVKAADGVENLDTKAGAVFQRSCAGCHSGGGNILQPAATLFKKDLDKNGLFSVDGIYDITYTGKNRMPGYGEKCAPRGQCTFGPRLSNEDIRALAEFVKRKADEGWVQ